MNVLKEIIKAKYNPYQLEVSYQTLLELLKIISNFKSEGSARLQAFVTMRKRNESEIQRLTSYLRDARAKMETEYERAYKYSLSYNKQFFNNIGDYYQVLTNALSKMRSHLSAMKTLLRRGCYQKSISNRNFHTPNTNPTSLIKNSVLGNATFCYSIFPMQEEPDVVKELFEQLKCFYYEEKKCLELCIKTIEQEKELRKRPEYCLMLLNEDRNRAWKKIENQIYLITDDVIKILKETNNVYIERNRFAQEEDFASFALHIFTECEMDHYHMINYCIGQNLGISDLELSIWKTQFETIDKVRLVVAEFDNLLPEDFKKSDMGRFIYYFCKWAFSSNIKKAHEYFTSNYKGKYKVTKYSSVSSHSESFSEEKVEYKFFINNISKLLSLNNKIDQREELEIVLSTN